MPLSGCEDDMIIACALVNYSQSCAPQVIYALWSLCCMPAILDVWERELKGRQRKGRRWGHQSEQAASCVNKRWVFFSIFSNNLTYCYTAAGRIIHSSAGSQNLNSNYKGDFCYLWLSCIIGSEVPSYTQRSAERKSIPWLLHVSKDLNINNLWVVTLTE